jgi:hypothetical protein
MPGGRAVAAAVLAATMAAGFAMDTEFAAEPLHESAGDGLMEHPRGSTMKTRLKALRVAAVSASAVVSFAVTESAQAQQPAAVQWRVEDGGNGHWYQGVFAADFISRTQSTEITKARGGTLVSIGSADESAWVFGVVASRAELWTLSPPFALGPWIGASAYIVTLSIVLAARWHRGAWRTIRVLETPEEEAAREAGSRAAS